MTFDPTKPCTTRDGREVRLFTERMKNGRLVGSVTDDDGQEHVATWFSSGSVYVRIASNLDLFNIPEKRTFWVNFYKNGDCTSHGTKEWADLYANKRMSTRLACVEVEFEEGEGL